MTDRASYPYDTHLDIRYGPLELVDIQALVDACTHPWYNQTLCRVNDSVVRLGVVEGEYHRHQHDDEDEFFYVVAGRFIVALDGRSAELTPRRAFVVPPRARPGGRGQALGSGTSGGCARRGRAPRRPARRASGAPTGGGSARRPPPHTRSGRNGTPAPRCRPPPAGARTPRSTGAGRR